MDEQFATQMMSAYSTAKHAYVGSRRDPTANISNPFESFDLSLVKIDPPSKYDIIAPALAMLFSCNFTLTQTVNGKRKARNNLLLRQES